MGRPNTGQFPGNGELIHVQQLEWVDGDYDQGGAYWGHTPGTHIFWAYTEDGEFERFYRARDFAHLKALLDTESPNRGGLLYHNPTHPL